MDRTTKILIAAAVLLALPLGIGLYRQYGPSLRHSLGFSPEIGERESIRQYVQDEFNEYIRIQDDITTTELRAQQAKGVVAVSIEISPAESDGVRYYTVSATLMHKGTVRGTAYGTVTVEPSQGGPPALHYDIRFDYAH